MSLLERIQARLCSRCHARERFAGLEVCASCADELVGQVAPSDGRPAWRRRDLSRDETGRLVAA